MRTAVRNNMLKIGVALAILVSCAMQALAGEASVEDELKDFRDRIADLERRLGVEEQPSAANLLDNLKKSAIARGLDFSILIEIEACYWDEQNVEAESDLTLATVELGLSATISDNLNAEMTLLWEEDETEPIDLDTAVIILHDLFDLPLELTAGKMYVPFGEFAGGMITDPMTLDMGETRETAALLAIQGTAVRASLGVFNGDVGDDRLENVVARIDIAPAKPLSAGAYYITDIRETDALEELISDRVADGGAEGHRVSAAGAYAAVSIRQLTVAAEYLQACQTFEAGVLDDARDLRPRAWAIDVTFALGEDWEIAGRYERSNEVPDFARTRYGATISHTLMDHVTLGLEVLRSDFKEGSDINAVTAQLAFEF